MESGLVKDIQVEELGLQEHTDESGETIGFHAVRLTYVGDNSEFQGMGMTLSMTPDTEPGDMEYELRIERAGQSLLAYTLQQVGDDPAQESASHEVRTDPGLAVERTDTEQQRP
jgi:hypothetical protein